ncbi:sulfur carrier protein ThiS [Legionella cardiaca]|uniref:Sulfur carrier protein ThiS n=1 Tax=Legionella cardiaca TaxID=1071983 RepID=A0ABY8AX89_9GAMM|nr:sulfur carrier protein ThiS [Legionella cardiaca]WED43767.1 sulfur carrier protein ThiS [Legionella cardiaca]
MISIYLNEEACQIESTQSLHDLLIQKKIVDQHFAVAINNHLVPRAVYKTTTLYAGDRVDIIVPMQGG